MFCNLNKELNNLLYKVLHGKRKEQLTFYKRYIVFHPSFYDTAWHGEAP